MHGARTLVFRRSRPSMAFATFAHPCAACRALRVAQGPAARLHARGVRAGESSAFAVSALTLL